MSTYPLLTMTGSGSAAGLGGSARSSRSPFSAMGSDRVRVPQSAASVPIAGPSNPVPLIHNNSEGEDQSSDEGSDQSDNHDDQSSGGSVPQLDEEEIEELRGRINSSIVVGTRTVLTSRQKWTRTKMFDLEMSEAKGGLIFDYDESSVIFGLICRIYDSRQIQGEEGPTLIVVPSEAHFDKWRRAARDFSNRFTPHNILIYHGRNRSPEAWFDRHRIVITTYKTLSRDQGYVNCGLLREDLIFLRVILDGGEVIRNERTKQSQACSQINALYHWCCTRNSQVIAAHQYGLFADFLGIPNAFDETEESLEQWILGDADDEAVAANPTSELENRSLIFQKVQFDRGQLGFYQAFEERLNEAGGQYLRPHALRRGGADTVCRMLLFSLLVTCRVDFVFRKSDPSRGGICNICKKSLEAGSNLSNCAECLEKVMSRLPSGPSRLSSPKIREMLNILHRTKNVSGERGRTVIVCQFRTFADAIGEHLTREGFLFERFHDTDINEKRAAMERIRSQNQNDPPVTVALVTVSPANIDGLDLEPFQTVILMDLWWNPLLDSRAFSDNSDVRVNIYKLYFENTIEGRVLELLNEPQPLNDNDQDIFPRLGIHSTPENLDYLLQPTRR